MKLQGVSAPIVGTTSLENLYDPLGMSFTLRIPSSKTEVHGFDRLQGTVNVKLTEEEIKELESPYTPQRIFGSFY